MSAIAADLFPSRPRSWAWLAAIIGMLIMLMMIRPFGQPQPQEEESSVTTACDAEAGTGVFKYVRSGAAGSNNGTSWANAWSALSSVSYAAMSAGDTVFIAAGSYTTGLPQASKGVIIRRASVDRHGSDTGWSSAFDGAVTMTPPLHSQFLGISATADGLVLDGVDTAPWDNHKFKVFGVRGFNGMIENDGADDVKICGIDLDGGGENPTETGGPEDGLRWDGGANTIIDRNYIHDFQQLGDEHNDGIQGPKCENIEIKNNRFKDNGIQIFLGDWEWSADRLCNGIWIHHNLIYMPQDGSYQTITFKGTNEGCAYTNKIEHNVFNQPDGVGAGILNLSTGTAHNCATNSFFRNNIVYANDTGGMGGVGSWTHSYNLYNSSGVSDIPTVETGKVVANPLFTDAANHDYTLTSGSPARGAGTNLGYATDFNGVTVANPPDIGAFQYVP